MKNKKAFTLIEVIIASAILSITVFGVYKLIGENSKLINNSDNFLQLNNLFLNTEECIKSKKDYFILQNIGSIEKIDFGTDLKNCNTGATISVEINNINHFIKTKITGTGADYRDIEINIEADGIGIQKKEFRLLYF
ncbi:MAG: prepilin-type N-terminal cleavage/methylation domain-containing protein [Candidatus Gracilibacteria bacterium]|nr:prepilin-type N-terminal cleavage/methylation domain-containing protein [Candidatus Gracilibacteria bacterium]MDQ7023080.1 prepilin-type N-terminal cleavage/methylation domain-containing protein [Candidatus Gracilibacteria bacterium]